MAQVHAPSDPRPQRKKIPKVVTTRSNWLLAPANLLIRLGPPHAKLPKQTSNCASWVRPIPDRTRSPRRHAKSVAWSALCSHSTGSAIPGCVGEPHPTGPEDVVEAPCNASMPHSPLHGELPYRVFHLPGRRPVQDAVGQAGEGRRWRDHPGEERLVALGADFGIGNADNLAERYGVADDGFNMRLSLWGIGVKQLGRRQSRQHEVELPGQVLRVANTRACALAEERRHEVGGVAHEQNAVVAERFVQQAAEAVDGAPHDVDIVR